MKVEITIPVHSAWDALKVTPAAAAELATPNPIPLNKASEKKELA
jgi:hypothetical protein